MKLLLALVTLVLAFAAPAYAPYAAIAFAVVTLWVWGVDRLLDFEPAWDELHLVTTEDAWSIPLYRYRKDDAKGAIMLVHGIYSSMHLFDLGPDESLARHLRAQGYDVYCLELRDMGRHGRRSQRLRVAVEGASFDEYVRYDLPAAVAHVCKISGFSRIDYVGHSMGAMVYFPYGGTAHGRAHLRTGVAIGGMGGLPKARWWRHVPLPWGLFIRIPHYGVKEAARYLLAPLVGIGWLVESRFLNPRHASLAARRRYFANGVANSPHTLISHFGAMYKQSALRSRDGRDDYAELLRENRVPTLVIAGDRDKIAPLPIVRLGYDGLGGVKEWAVFKDFGHSDLVFGSEAQKHIWPALDAWLDSHSKS